MNGTLKRAPAGLHGSTGISSGPSQAEQYLAAQAQSYQVRGRANYDRAGPARFLAVAVLRSCRTYRVA